VDGARHQLLAGAALSGDEHRSGRRGDLLDHPVELEHGGALPDELVQAAEADHLAPEEEDLLAHGRPLQPLQEDGLEAFGIDGLGQVVVDAAPRGFDRALDRAVRCQHDARRLAAAVLQFGDQLEAGPPGELQVGHDQVGRRLLHARERLLGVRGELHLVAEARDDAGKALADSFFVVNDQDASRHAHRWTPRPIGCLPAAGPNDQR